MVITPGSGAVRVFLAALAALALAVSTSARRTQGPGQPPASAPGPARAWQDTIAIPACEDGLPDPISPGNRVTLDPAVRM